MTKSKPKKPNFFKTYLKEKKQVGALAPSSRFLVKKMCSKIDFNESKHIIELGPGTGVFTKEILKRARPDAKIFVFELNSEFYKLLKQKFKDPRIVLINDSAEKLQEKIKENGVEKVDAILSSLPLTIIPPPVKSNILDAVYSVLKKGGIFTQYQYSLSAKSIIEERFGKLKMSFSSINLPPAFIYCGIK